jgi:bacterioferritin-associated ferredoxin
LTQIIIPIRFTQSLRIDSNSGFATMYVCLCKGITDHQIKAAIDNGASSLGQLRKALGVASQCGKCSVMTREILDEAMSETPMANGLPQFYALA